MSDRLPVRIKQVSRHRNGASGEGFHAVVFETRTKVCTTCGGSFGWGPVGCRPSQQTCENRHPGPPVESVTRMLGVVFEARGHVAVFDIAKLADPAVGVAFGDNNEGNSWRGDRFESQLRAAVASYDKRGRPRNQRSRPARR